MAIILVMNVEALQIDLHMYVVFNQKSKDVMLKTRFIYLEARRSTDS